MPQHIRLASNIVDCLGQIIRQCWIGMIRIVRAVAMIAHVHRNHAATINIEDPSIDYAEAFVDLRPAALPEARDRADGLLRFLLGDG